MEEVVSTRAVRLPEDAEFLLAVYRSTRQDEITGFGWTGTQADAFVALQYEAQSRHYGACFPDAEHSVVLVDGRAAGRLLVERSESAVHIVDISLLPSFQRAGVGGELVHRLLDEADNRGVAVTCHVYVGNDALLFWERLGFVATEDKGAYIALERPCGISRH
ncbi:MAG TPA: GNAT family N-acetyltransferase [Acidimicrobiales bacterium]|nr:GNAT family N-acetyltransferase [Acidimicrobiales bacterium]